MMFSKLTVAAILAVATTSFAQNACCDSTTTAGAPGIATLLGLLGVVAQGVNVPIGLGCSPITVSNTLSTTRPPVTDYLIFFPLLGRWCLRNVVHRRPGQLRSDL